MFFGSLVCMGYVCRYPMKQTFYLSALLYNTYSLLLKHCCSWRLVVLKLCRLKIPKVILFGQHFYSLFWFADGTKFSSPLICSYCLSLLLNNQKKFFEQYTAELAFFCYSMSCSIICISVGNLLLIIVYITYFLKYILLLWSLH